MKKTLILFLGFSFIISGLWAQNQRSKMDTVSYDLGVLIAQNLKRQGLEAVNPTELARGIADALSGMKIDLAQCNATVSDYMQKVQEQKQAENAKKFEKNIAEGKKFLAENKQKTGIVTTASGLQYQVLQAGTGAKPTTADRVTVHYTGSLLDGTVFDSSVERGQPATFGVTQVIQGWVEGLQLMTPGSKYRFFIPADLGYGPGGAGDDIPPHSTLIFEVELLKIN